ncbi:MAG: hypothetical protein ACLUFV_01500 [Acutalibacteraceae bacterium]
MRTTHRSITSTAIFTACIPNHRRGFRRDARRGGRRADRAGRRVLDPSSSAYIANGSAQSWAETPTASSSPAT